MSVLNPHRMSLSSASSYGPFSGDYKLRIPRLNLLALFRKNADGTIVDSIGLSVSDYNNIDPNVRSLFFIDSETKRDNADIVNLALASPYLNIPGGTLFGDVDSGVVLYISGQQPVEAEERRLWRYMFGTQFEPLYVDGEALLINNTQLYIEA